MAKGISLHIGINYTNRLHYGTPLKLKWCTADAEAMAELAKESGYEPKLLLNEKASSGVFLEYLDGVAASLNDGDIFLLSFSGHGARCTDKNKEETDQLDEAWVFHDRMVIDDEARVCWSRFKKGVRIVIISDCCYSGALLDHPEYCTRTCEPGGERYRFLMQDQVDKIFSNNSGYYREIHDSLPDMKKIEVKASLVQLAACGTDEQAIEYDYYRHGVFTYALMEVWKAKKYNNYYNFLDLIASTIPRTTQHPCIIACASDSRVFRRQRPFEI